MAEDFDTVSKAELAKELKCSKPMISRLVREGLPVRSDGKISLLAAMRWVKRNVSPSWGGGGIHSKARWWLIMFDRPST
jgi:hypothetical protein